MNRGRIWPAALFALVVVAIVALFWSRGEAERSSAASPPRPSAPSSTSQPKQEMAVTNAAAAPLSAIEGESHIADELNAPGGTIQRDLQILSDVFDMWQTNFPHDGNPVGLNAEITAALRGENSLRFAFIPPRHPAINAAGELCDRWGTPFRFHQISGHRMEIRSAGADRKFGTADDATIGSAEN